MKISPDIRNALSQLIGHYGNATQLAKGIGVAHTTVLAWMSGKSDEISGDVWYERLEPKLHPFLPSGKGMSEVSSPDGAPPPASSLAFVRRLRRQAPLRPIEEAIMEKLKGMTELQLAKLYSELVYGAEAEGRAIAADRNSAYNAGRRRWLFFIPRTDGGESPGSIAARLKGVASLEVLRQGPFDWGLVNWRLVPQAEAAAFDDFLLFSFAQPAPYVVKELLPLFKPYGFVVEMDLAAKPADLLNNVLPDGLFHISPYHEAAYGKGIKDSEA